jgi:hypothetical protein
MFDFYKDNHLSRCILFVPFRAFPRKLQDHHKFSGDCALFAEPTLRTLVYDLVHIIYASFSKTSAKVASLEQILWRMCTFRGSSCRAFSWQCLSAPYSPSTPYRPAAPFLTKGLRNAFQILVHKMFATCQIVGKKL